MALPQHFLQELKHRSSIEAVISTYLPLKRRGKNLVGLCPFHNEKTPSFTAYPENGSFYCFGCGAGGDVITFIMRVENLDYLDAVRLLAQRAGMQMPEDGYDDSLARLRTRLLEINRETARYFHDTLFSDQGRDALAYLQNRGLSGRMIKRFGLGFAPDTGFALVNYLRAKGFTQAELVQANVAMLSKKGHAYDRFRARLMFPIIDLRGNVVAFGGRILTDEKPKYINTSDTPVYHKGGALFAMNFAKDSGERRLILAEGYMDVIALHQAGFTNAIASLGTALTEDQARVMKRYADEAVICYDADEAGQRATQRAIAILNKTGLYVKVLTLPGAKDPDAFLQRHKKEGPARLKQLLETSGSDIDYRLQKLKADFNLDASEGKIRYLQSAVKIIGEIDDQIAQDVYAAKLSEETGVDRKAIIHMANEWRRQYDRKRTKDERKRYNEVVAAKTMLNTDKALNLRVANAEEGVIAYLFANQDQILQVEKQISPENMNTSFARRVYGLLLGKNKFGEFSISDFSQDLSKEEMSELARILATRQAVLPSKKDIEAYINVIMRETGYRRKEVLKEASTEEIKAYLEVLKREKSRGNK